jgi:uncharacterized surface protein with fasciclin (FAS1) repeats
MKRNTLFVALVLVAAAAVTPAAHAIEMPKKAAEAAGKMGDLGGILAAAKSAGNLNTFLTAVNAAGLTETLSGKGPFTVFAPTDEAFAKLPDGALDDLLKPANKAKLAGILGGHVVPGKLMASDAMTMKATNVNGQDLGIAVVGDVFQVEGANVVQKDIAADNGVIHAIDTVIIPSADPHHGPQDKPKDHPAH